MALPIDVLADLRLSVDGEDINIRGEGDHLIVDLPSLRAGRRLVTTGPFALGNRERKIRSIHETLTLADISAEVRLQGDQIARFGAGAQPGAVSRFLNLGPVEVRPTQPLLQAIRRRPLVAVAVFIGLLLLVAWLVRGQGN